MKIIGEIPGCYSKMFIVQIDEYEIKKLNPDVEPRRLHPGSEVRVDKIYGRVQQIGSAQSEFQKLIKILDGIRAMISPLEETITYAFSDEPEPAAETIPTPKTPSF